MTRKAKAAPKRGGARPGAGRPSTRPEGARVVQVVLEPDVVAIWEATVAGERSALVNAAVRDSYSPGDEGLRAGQDE